MLKKALLGVALLVLVLGGAAITVGPPEVPASAIAHSVNRDPALLDLAWRLPVAATYRREPYWQRNGSLCGPASLVNVFRSLSQTYADERAVLDGSGKCRLGFCYMGLTLEELQAVAQARTSAKVTVLRDLDAASFRAHLLRANDPSRRYIVNFSRKPIFGAGAGHHSPIAGYLSEQDLVLVLDVNEAFEPWLIERDRLFAAIDTVDAQSGRKRGLLLIEP